MGNKAATSRRAARKTATRKTLDANPSVADALFSTTQQRVLSLLFGQPARSFFTKEMIDLAGGGRGAIQREIDGLFRSGLLVQTTRGNQKHYQANPASPVYAELCSIASKLLGPADALRQALAPLADEVDLAFLYGSVAARRDTANSDIDVLIVSDALTLEKTYATLAPAEAHLGRKVNPTLYTTSEFRKRIAKANPFLSKILAGETIALIGDKDAVAGAR